MTYSIRPQFDERDAALRAERQRLFDQRPGIRVGDVVELSPERVERVSYHWGDRVQTSPSGEWHWNASGSLSFGGSLNPSIPIAELVITGECEAPVWFFHHGRWGKDRGVDTLARVRVYRWEPR